MQFIDPSPSVEQYRNQVGWHNSDQVKQMSQDWATMYYQNAYNTAVMNYMNEYNSPLEQMRRYQDAGLSPWLVAGEMASGNMSSGPSGAAPRGHFTEANAAQKQAASIQTINSLNDVVKSAADMYGTIRYGYPLQQQQLENMRIQGANLSQTGQNLGVQFDILNENLRKYAAEADWAQYWNYPVGYGADNLAESPRARYMEFSTEFKAAQVKQISSLVGSLYPSWTWV